MALDFTTDFSTLVPLDTLVPRYDVFVSGESHNVAGNEQRHFKLFAYLHKKAGVRYYVKEGSYTYAYFVDRYVQTGQPQWLDSAATSLREQPGKPSAEMQREFGLWQQLRRLNEAADDDQKIQVVAIDTEPYWTNGLLRDLITRHPQVPPALQATVQELLVLRSRHQLNVMQLHRLDQQRLKPVLARVWALVQAHETEARAWLGDDYRHLVILVNNPAALQRNERELANNFERLQQALPAGAYFLQYGRLHAQLNIKTLGGPWLAGQLQKQHRVLSILPKYDNCLAAWNNQPYPDARWLSKAEKQLLQQVPTATNHTLVLTSGLRNSLRSLSKYGQIFILEKDLRFE